MARNNFFAVTLVCALLSACASTGALPSAQPVAPYRDSVELAGRLSVNYQREGKPESLSGKFVWQQRGERVDVSLASPLGQTIAAIHVEPGLATLTRAGQAPCAAADVDSLSAQALGWSLPVSGLRDWLQGYAVDADGKRFAASPLHAGVTTRDGWRLNFLSWQDGAVSQPKRIDAERGAGLYAEPVAIRIVIDPTPP